MPKKIEELQCYPGAQCKVSVRLEYDECEKLNQIARTLVKRYRPASMSDIIRRAITRFHEDGFWLAGEKATAIEKNSELSIAKIMDDSKNQADDEATKSKRKR